MCNNDNIGMKSAYLYFYNDFPLFFVFLLTIHEYANNADLLNCIIDHGMKNLCLSFNLVQNLVSFG